MKRGVLVLATVIACGGAKSKPPAYVSDVDQVLAAKPAPREVAAADRARAPALEGRPVGALSDDDRQRRRLHALSRRRRGHVRPVVRADARDRSNKLVIKLCLPRARPDDASAGDRAGQRWCAATMNPPPKDVTLAGAAGAAGRRRARGHPRAAGSFAGTVKTRCSSRASRRPCGRTRRSRSRVPSRRRQRTALSRARRLRRPLSRSSRAVTCP